MSLAKDARALLGVLEGPELRAALAPAAVLQATVTDKGLDQDAYRGVQGVARRVARSRVISTVDRQARHGHQTSHRSFDGYRAASPPTLVAEIMATTDVTAGNSRNARGRGGADRRPAARRSGQRRDRGGRPGNRRHHSRAGVCARGGSGRAADCGDAAYGSGELVERVEDAKHLQRHQGAEPGLR